MSDAPPSTPPGWYPDQAGVTRWWDGTTWGPEAPAATQKPLSTIAVVGFVASLVSIVSFFWLAGLVASLAGLIFSIYGIKETGTAGKRGNGLAVAGMIISALTIIGSIGLVVRNTML